MLDLMSSAFAVTLRKAELGPKFLNMRPGTGFPAKNGEELQPQFWTWLSDIELSLSAPGGIRVMVRLRERNSSAPNVVQGACRDPPVGIPCKSVFLSANGSQLRTSLDPAQPQIPHPAVIMLSKCPWCYPSTNCNGFYPVFTIVAAY
jgi:hypothetical protein